jgi:hypothetical protein
MAAPPTGLYGISCTGFDTVASAYLVLDKKVFWHLARALAIRLRHTDAELQVLEES